MSEWTGMIRSMENGLCMKCLIDISEFGGLLRQGNWVEEVRYSTECHDITFASSVHDVDYLYVSPRFSLSLRRTGAPHFSSKCTM
jgi:hypothetical protein